MRLGSAQALTAADRGELRAIELKLFSDRHADRVAAVEDAGHALRRLRPGWHELLRAAKPAPPDQVWDLWVEVVSCLGRTRTIRQQRLLRLIVGRLAATPADTCLELVDAEDRP